MTEEIAALRAGLAQDQAEEKQLKATQQEYEQKYSLQSEKEKMEFHVNSNEDMKLRDPITTNTRLQIKVESPTFDHAS